MDEAHKHDEHHQTFEISKITDQIYVGTNLCCGLRSHIQILADEDIRAEVDMELERTDSPPKIDAYLWLPVKDKMAPTQEQLEVGVAMITKVVKQGKKVYVHCKYGHGRGPTMAIAYFISTGLSVEEAVKKVKSRRPEIHPNEVQMGVLRRYGESLG